MMWLFFVFVAVPLVEIGLFVTLGGMIGLWATLAWVVATGALGILMLRRMGQTGRTMISRRIVGSDLLSPIAHQVMLFAASVLLILPGFLTDGLGLLLLLPFVRKGLILLAKRRFSAMPSQPSSASTVIIDGDYEVYSEPSTETDASQSAPRLSGWVNSDQRRH
jgi:UPF0716 protein FxsA